MSNVGALQQVVDYLRANPDKHNQGEWVCGTTGCIAGWAVALSGLTDISNLHAAHDEGELDVEGEGKQLLGLNDREAYALFVRTANRWADGNSEANALELADAIIARDKASGPLTDTQRDLLSHYGLTDRPVTA
jgi:hypothetical protein